MGLLGEDLDELCAGIFEGGVFRVAFGTLQAAVLMNGAQAFFASVVGGSTSVHYGFGCQLGGCGCVLAVIPYAADELLVLGWSADDVVRVVSS